MIGVICILVLAMEFVFQMSFPKWGLIFLIALLIIGIIYSFYIQDCLQGIMCIIDIVFLSMLTNVLILNHIKKTYSTTVESGD